MDSGRVDKEAAKFRNWVSAIFFALTLGVGTAAHAGPVQLPPINLGTSFQDMIAFPGWVVQEIIEYYHAGQFKDQQGDNVPGSNKLTAVSAITQLAYISNLRILGGFYAAEILLPLADVDADTSFGPKAREQGVGDLILGPFAIQWIGHKLFDMPYFHRFVFVIMLPTGAYNRNRPVNVGNNLVSINPYYGFTIMPADRLELNLRLSYLWNSENDEPFVGLGAASIQPGQAFYVNYAAAYEVVKGLRLGISGYALQQFSDHEVDGRKIDGSRERVFGVGPGVHFAAGNKFFISVNSYFETGAENRPEGRKIIFRLIKPF